MRKVSYVILGITFLGIITFSLRYPILRAIGSYLICEDPIEHADAIFILGGGAYSRGYEGEAVYAAKKAPYIVCLGAWVPPILTILNNEKTESEITRQQLINLGVPDSAIVLLPNTTSTREESNEIFRFCKENNVRKAIIISDKFHTRRTYMVVKKKYRAEGIQTIIRGSPSKFYDEKFWWRFEMGMITVNNEYMKILYYSFH